MRRALGLCLLLAACSSSAGNGGPAGSTAPGFTQSAGPTKGDGTFAATSAPVDTTPASASVAAPSTPSGPVACTGAQLTVTGHQDVGGSAAGHERAILVFTNTSSTTCTVFGYPGVDGIPPRPGSGQVQHFRRTLRGMLGGLPTGNDTRPVVTLAPGAAASAIAEVSSVPSGSATDCEPFENLMVTPPNTSATVTLPIDSLPSCDPQIHPVVSGTGG